MKRLKKLNSVVREYNGLIAKYSRESTRENEEAVKQCFEELKVVANEVLD